MEPPVGKTCCVGTPPVWEDDPEGPLLEADGLDADDRALLASFREPARRQLQEFGTSGPSGSYTADFLADNLLVERPHGCYWTSTALAAGTCSI
jgi:hypothetical protein